jgi:UDP-glucose 6-dehydrogenase
MSVQSEALVGTSRGQQTWLNDASRDEFATPITPRRISVFGLGYVGAVSLACLARDGHEMFGVDIDPNKLELLRRGQAPIVETGIQELMRAVVRGGSVTVTDSVRDAILATDLSFVCVVTADG